MASYTSRIILILAVPSLFGVLSILFFKKKKKISLEDSTVIGSKLRTSVLSYQPLSSMKLKTQSSRIDQSADMQLKENPKSSESNGGSNGHCFIESVPLNAAAAAFEVSYTNGVSYAAKAAGQTITKSEPSDHCNGHSDEQKVPHNTSAKSSHVNGISYAAKVAQQVNPNCRIAASNTTEISNGSPQSKKMENGSSSVLDKQPLSSNGTGARPKTRKTESVTQNGACANGMSKSTLNFSNLDKVPKNSGSISQNGTSINGSSRSTLNQNALRKNNKAEDIYNGLSTNGNFAMPVVEKYLSSNGTYLESSKPKRKSKNKVQENSHSCSLPTAINGSKIDNTALSNDNMSELSNGLQTLTIDNETPLPDQTICDPEIKDMYKNSCPVVQSDEANQVRTISSQLSDSSELSECDSANTLLSEIAESESAKEYDTTVPLKLVDAQIASSESGRSSNSSEIAENPQIDIVENLTFSDCMVATGSSLDDMIEIPDAVYCDSVGSNDSGTGGSEILYGIESQNTSMIFEFDIPSQYCGLLIGKKGSHVNFIKEKTNAVIWIRTFPFDKEKKVVAVAGDENEIHAALGIIRDKFPKNRYPELTLEPSCVNSAQIVCPPSLKLALPEAVEFQVVLSATINAGHFFVQLPTHPSYHALLPFTLSMTAMYSHCDTPEITEPCVGNIVAAPVAEGWFRAEIVEVCEDDKCKLKYLDYGGYQIVPRCELRQINIEYMQMPFQATECYLSNVTCHEEIGWTAEAKTEFERLAHGQILSAYVAAIAEDGIPCLYLYQVNGATNTFINQAMIETGLLKWVVYDS